MKTDWGEVAAYIAIAAISITGIICVTVFSGGACS